ncbi:MAG: magnesium transporter [Actinobacteria bacterium]|nr:magnesium transporter [Actinomycetota bacterium]
MRRLLAHWSSERATLRQGTTALTICITVTLFAGIILGEMEGVLADTPGLLVLVPSAIGMRGAIFGALGARLGTGMLTGQFTTDLRRGSFTADNVEAALLVSLSTAVLTAGLAWGASAVFGLDVVDVFQLVIVSSVGAVLSSLVVLVVTLLLARTAQARSWDMDAIGTPVISATADISTLPALLLGVLLLGSPVVHIAFGLILIAAAAAATIYGLRHPSALARRIVRESAPVLGYAAVMGVLAGTVLETRLDTLIADPALLVAIPPFIAASGALGGILSARLSSQLHIGLLQPARVPDRRAALEGSMTGLLGLIGFTVVGLATAAGAAAFAIGAPPTLQLTAAIVTGGLLSTAVVFVVAFYAATASYRFGLDPDTSSIPIVTSSIDFLGILCLVIGISVVGLG